MDELTATDPGLAPVYRDDPRLAPLIGPGAPFEVEAVVVDGIALRDFVRAPRTIVDVFAMGDGHADLVHVVYGDERWTHAELRRQARSLARELQTTFGVQPGDRVAIAMRNLPEYVVAFWGAALNGAVVREARALGVPVPVNESLWRRVLELQASGLRGVGA
jgi:non-ribosomal peptide synthetase component F